MTDKEFLKLTEDPDFIVRIERWKKSSKDGPPPPPKCRIYREGSIKKSYKEGRDLP